LLDDRAAVLNDRYIRGLMTQALKVAGHESQDGHRPRRPEENH
jgi:hypothetical protein